MDDKVKRRLAQNREAARKSRQRRKAYVQNLEEEVHFRNFLLFSRSLLPPEVFACTCWWLHPSLTILVCKGQATV